MIHGMYYIVCFNLALLPLAYNFIVDKKIGVTELWYCVVSNLYREGG